MSCRGIRAATRTRAIRADDKGARKNFAAIGVQGDIFEKTQLSADAGFHTEHNMKMLFEEQIDGYVADILFRKRDHDLRRPIGTNLRGTKNPKSILPRRILFTTREVKHASVLLEQALPQRADIKIRGFRFVKFRGAGTHCVPCPLRAKCLRDPERTLTRQVVFFTGRATDAPETYTQKMKKKIDTPQGRSRYSQRLGIVAPVFANICSTLGLRQLVYEARPKSTLNRKLFCIVHNLLKIHRYGPGFA